MFNGTIEHLMPRANGSDALIDRTDEELLLDYRSRSDRPAFEELVRRYEKELYGYLRHYLGDADMADDVFQQTFLQVHLKCDQFEEGRKVRPWLVHGRHESSYRLPAPQPAAQNNQPRPPHAKRY